MDESTLGVHEIELVIQTRPGLGDSGGVAHHAGSARNLGQITTRYNSWWPGVDAYLERSWTPVNEMNGALGLKASNGFVNIFGNHVTTIKQTAGHIFALTRIALYQLVSWVKAGIWDFCDGELLMISLLSWDDWGVSNEREMDTRVWDQIGLNIQEIDIELTINIIKAPRCRNWRCDLADKAIEGGVSRALNVQIIRADVIDGFVINYADTVGVLQGGMSGKDSVVWLNNGGWNTWSGVDCKFKLGLFPIILRQTFHNQRGKTRASAATEAVENEKSLKTCALFNLYEMINETKRGYLYFTRFFIIICGDMGVCVWGGGWGVGDVCVCGGECLLP